MSNLKNVFKSISKKNFELFKYVNNKKTSVFTKLDHSREEIDDFLINQMAKQTKLKKWAYRFGQLSLIVWKIYWTTNNEWWNKVDRLEELWGNL